MAYRAVPTIIPTTGVNTLARAPLVDGNVVWLDGAHAVDGESLVPQDDTARQFPVLRAGRHVPQ